MTPSPVFRDRGSFTEGKPKGELRFYWRKAPPSLRLLHQLLLPSHLGNRGGLGCHRLPLHQFLISDCLWGNLKVKQKLTTYLALNHSRIVIENHYISVVIANYNPSLGATEAVTNIGFYEFRRQGRVQV
ncbi:MAG: hypothetical protein O4751_08785 [Trichodesmium sp. St2_bin6]|nr:hypothetical protein [Trichodesmium sp. St2_bin6]